MTPRRADDDLKLWTGPDGRTWVQRRIETQEMDQQGVTMRVVLYTAEVPEWRPDVAEAARWSPWPEKSWHEAWKIVQAEYPKEQHRAVWESIEKASPLFRPDRLAVALRDLLNADRT